MTSPLPKSVRKELAAIGYKTPDRKDLAAFQAARGIKTEKPGVVDVSTKKALDEVSRWSKKHDSTFVRGQQNGVIRAQESRLKALGYDVGKVDGTFDAQTVKGLVAFKKDHPELKNTFRYMGKQVRHLAAHELQNRNHAPWHIRVRPSIGHRRLDAATQKAVDAGMTVGANGRAVKNVELRLKAAGFNPQKIDGKFDERTAAAVSAFQSHAKLPVTGVVDPATWRELKKSYVYTRKGSMTVGEHSKSVKKAEKVLKKLGYQKVKADGTFDAQTAKAVRSFERKHKLEVDGNISSGELKRMKKEAAKGEGDDAFKIAKKMLGKSAIWLQTHGPLGKFMHDGIPQNVNCANFVSSCLEYAGLISSRQHNDGVTNLANNLRADKDWGRTSLSHAKPGDVCVVNGGGHVVMFAGRDRNGNPLFIGSNNRMNVAGHPQYVSIHGGYSPIEIFHYQG